MLAAVAAAVLTAAILNEEWPNSETSPGGGTAMVAAVAASTPVIPNGERCNRKSLGIGRTVRGAATATADGSNLRQFVGCIRCCQWWKWRQ